MPTSVQLENDIVFGFKLDGAPAKRLILQQVKFLLGDDLLAGKIVLHAEGTPCKFDNRQKVEKICGSATTENYFDERTLLKVKDEESVNISVPARHEFELLTVSERFKLTEDTSEATF